MPTGLTSGVYDGDTSLRNYILKVARGMGFLILMRDDAPDAEIPKTLVPSDYHQRQIENANKEIEDLMGMTPNQMKAEAAADYAQKVASYEQSRADNGRRAKNYTQMIADVEAWAAPEKLSGMKDYMLKQLRESYEFDVSDMDSPKSYWKPPVEMSPELWHADALARATKNLSYHTDEWEKELERTAERQSYLDAMWESIPNE